MTTSVFSTDNWKQLWVVVLAIALTLFNGAPSFSQSTRTLFREYDKVMAHATNSYAEINATLTEGEKLSANGHMDETAKLLEKSHTELQTVADDLLTCELIINKSSSHDRAVLDKKRELSELIPANARRVCSSGAILGNVYRMTSAPGRAIAPCQQALNIDNFTEPHHKKSCLLTLSDVYRLLGDTTSAEKYLHLAGDENNEYLRWYALYLDKGQLKAAQQVIEKSLSEPTRRGTSKAICCFADGSILALQGQKEVAEGKYMQGQSLLANSSSVLNQSHKLWIGRCERDLQHYSQAIKTLSGILDSSLISADGRCEAFLIRAFCFAKTGDHAKAREDLNQATMYLPNMPRFKNDYLEVSSLISSNPAHDISPSGQRFALVVGISDFAEEGIPHLRYAAKDAKDLSSFLITSLKFAPAHVRTLTDQDATRENILDALGDHWLPTVTKENDVILIFIASHGTPSYRDVGALSYVACHDTKKDRLFTTAIPMQQICSLLCQRLKGRKHIVVLDTCYSGAASLSPFLEQDTKERHENIDPTMLVTGAQQLVLSSSSPKELSWESKRYQNGVFTHNLMSMLSQHIRSRSLQNEFEGLIQAVQSEVQKDDGVTQVPCCAGAWTGTELFDR